jgi:hypothetical protein
MLENIGHTMSTPSFGWGARASKVTENYKNTINSNNSKTTNKLTIKYCKIMLFKLLDKIE